MSFQTTSAFNFRHLFSLPFHDDEDFSVTELQRFCRLYEMLFEICSSILGKIASKASDNLALTQLFWALRLLKTYSSVAVNAGAGYTEKTL